MFVVRTRLKLLFKNSPLYSSTVYSQMNLSHFLKLVAGKRLLITNCKYARKRSNQERYLWISLGRLWLEEIESL